MRRGKLPTVRRFQEQGTYALASAVVPTFTNPNNLSIVTGAPPVVHGISGNFFLNPDTGAEVMMNDPSFLRADTILAALSRQGARVAVITAKDKLRRLLGYGLQHGICFSAEKAHEATLAEHGIEKVNTLVGWETPEVYSSQLSEFVMEAGLCLYQQQTPDVMYLSLTDYIQHKHAPGTPVADQFYQTLDRYFAAFDALGAVVGITATIYAHPTVDLQRLVCRLKSVEGLEYVGTRVEACRDFELPTDRIGDVVVISNHCTVLGKAPQDHDLSLLDGGLRSHGGLAEQEVPLLLNKPLNPAYSQRLASMLRNFDLFDLALNGVVALH